MATQPKLLSRGRYVLGEVVGEGGMAVVHRAWDRQAQRWCAIKMLSPIMAMHRDPKERFRQEAHVLAGLAHPNIVTVYELKEEDKLFYLVMELVDGGDVSGWVRRNGPMPASLAVRVILDVCGALKAAHSQGIVHRDVKPDNVLIGADGCRLVDFGVARLRDASMGLTRTGIRMGTRGFIPPEQVVDAKRADPQADQYSAAATLMFLVSGKTPMPVARHLEELGQALGPELGCVVMRATLPDPEDRYASVQVFADALRETMTNLPTLQDAPPLYMKRPEPPIPDIDAWE